MRALVAFDSRQAHWFFGRDALTAELLGRLDQRLRAGGPLVLVAPSGAGKSSLLKAGLLPAIENGALPARGSEQWPRLLFTPTSEPLSALIGQLAAALGVSVERVGAAAEAGAPACTVLVRDALRGRGRLVLVVDQLEELFTLCTSEPEQHAFLDALSALASAGPAGEDPLALVVYGLRSDFYTPCANYPQLRNALQDGQIVVGPLSEEGAREAILFPARSVGLEVEPGLVELLLRDLGSSPGNSPPDAVTPLGAADGYEAGRLPLLAHALRATWQTRHGHTLTVDGYRATGGIPRAVATTAEQLFAGLDPQGQRAVCTVFLRLVKIGDGVDDTRRRLDHRDIASLDSDAASVIEVFTQGRLLTREQDGVEITHEVLLRAWPRLHRWIEADRTAHLIRRELEDAAGEWERSRYDASLLYRGNRLNQAREWASTSDEHRASPTAAAFLTASVQHWQRATRLRRSAIAVLAILALVASTTAVIAFQQRSAARDERDTAVFHRLMVEADRLRSTQPSLATQFDLAAYHRRPRGASNPDLTSRLITDASSPQATTLSGHTNDVNSVAFSPDSRTLASGGTDGVRLWSTAPPSRSRPLDTPQATITDNSIMVRFSPDGQTLAGVGDDGLVRLWDMTDPSRPEAFGRTLNVSSGSPSPQTAINSVTFNPSGDTLAATDPGGLSLWDLNHPNRPRLIKRLASGAVFPDGVVFSPNGKLLAVSYETQVRLWNVTDPQHPQALGKPLQQPYVNEFNEHANGKLALAFSPDGRTLVSADQDVRFWNISDPARPKPKPWHLIHGGDVDAVAFSPDGRVLASVGSGQNVLLWDVFEQNGVGLLAKPLQGHITRRVLDVTFSPDGESLATTSGDRSVLLWHLPRVFLKEDGQYADSVAGHQKEQALAIALANGAVRLWSLNHLDRVQQLAAPFPARVDDGEGEWQDDPWNTVQFSPSGTVLADAGGGGPRGFVRLWDTSDLSRPKLLGQMFTHEEFKRVRSLAFSPDGRVLAVAGGYRVTIFDISRPDLPRQVVASLLGPVETEEDVYSLSFSSDGKLLAGADDEARLRLWDMTDPARPKEFTKTPTDHDVVTQATFVPGDRTLVTAGADETIRVWDVADPTRPKELGKPMTGHTGAIGSLALSPDGHVVASASADETVRLWDISNPARPQRLGQPLAGHHGEVSSVAFSADGRTLVSQGPNGPVRLWQLEEDQAVQRLCRTTGNTLTRGEWERRVPELPYRPNCH
ncbi:hypothetical protein ACIBMX_48605 [Streptomyces phaeochromogenes]|uniref:nSTAND1 domain-containing NTPase n=1 Tax=Streptomyces phaeochromogenes TaxID=1923 RepID=UPI0037B56F3F